MDGDPTTVGTIVGAVIGGIASGVLGALGYLRKQSAKEKPTRSSVELRVQEERAEEGRLVRIEANTALILTKQQEHAEADERRFRAIEEEHKRVREKVHNIADDVTRHNIEVPRLRDDLRLTRKQLNLDSEVVRVPRDD